MGVKTPANRLVLMGQLYCRQFAASAAQ